MFWKYSYVHVSRCFRNTYHQEVWHTHTMPQPHILMILFLLEIDQFLQNDSRCQDSSLKYALIFRVNKSQEQQAEKKSFVLRQKIFFRKYKPQKTKLTKLVQKKPTNQKKCHWTWIACRISTLNPVKTHNARKSSLTTPWRKSRLLYHHFQVS